MKIPRIGVVLVPVLLLVVLVSGCSRSIDGVTADYEAARAADPALTEFRWDGLDRAERERLDGLSVALEELQRNLRIVGMSAAVVRGQELVWARGYGFADIERGIPAAPSTPYCLASLTKPFAAALLLGLVEEGNIDLDDPVSDYGIRIASPGVVRVRHLLSHTSSFRPGAYYRYDGDRFARLDHVLAHATGSTFGTLVRERIIEPLGLADTAPGLLEIAVMKEFLDSRAEGSTAVRDPDGVPYELGDLTDDDDPNIAATAGVALALAATVIDTGEFDLSFFPHLPVDEATLESFQEFWSSREIVTEPYDRLAKPYALSGDLTVVPDRYVTNGSPSAGLVSSVVDLARFDAAIDWYLLVSRATQDLAFTPVVTTAGDTLPYGLGWFTQRYRGKTLRWHYGHWRACSTLIVKVPSEETTFVLLANTDALSRPFPLGAGDLLDSPAALLFLRHMIFDRGEGPAVLDWLASPDDLARAVGAVSDPVERDLLRRELAAAAGAAGAGLLGDRAPEEFFRALADASCEEYISTVDLPVLARIADVGSGEHRTEEFVLDEARRVRVFATGEGLSDVVWDYGWIEDAATGETVWFSSALGSRAAGGAAKNRRTETSIDLPAGAYRLHYRTDASHAFGDWNDAPPDDGFWGVVAWDDGPAEMAAGTSWERAESPEDLGWSSAWLDSVGTKLSEAGSAAYLVVTDGRIVYEWGDVSYPFRCHSVRKSIMSGLYGPYVVEGAIDRDATLADLGIEESPPLTETERTATVADLLKARSGVYIAAMGETPAMEAQRPERGSHEPGTFWYYNNWDFNVLGMIFERETGEEIGDAFYVRIAEPIGMEDYSPGHVTYQHQARRSIHPRYEFRMSARDLARYGQLWLQKGRWNGSQVIPVDWVEEATTNYSHGTGSAGIGYGYMWWVVGDDALDASWPPGSYLAAGHGGHYMLVIPSLDTIIVHRANTDLPPENMVSDQASFAIIAQTLAARLAVEVAGVSLDE